MKRGTRSRRGRGAGGRSPGGRRGRGAGGGSLRGRRARRRGSRAPVISDLTAQRLSIYLRCLDDLGKGGVETVSSQHLAERFSLNSAQIRKDLACFGEFGVRGVGYVVSDLKRNLTRILGLVKNRKVVIVGAGNLGMALADYGGFNREGFSIAALLDNDPRKVGRASRGGVPILDVGTLPSLARRERVSIAVLAVPAQVAQETLDWVTRSGIRAVLNFAPTRLRARPGVTLKVVDLKIQLENLAFHLARARGA
ncbi:MAG: redox-sensing transcriptional repressor Rex [Acidobacteriota bacterium]